MHAALLTWLSYFFLEWFAINNGISTISLLVKKIVHIPIILGKKNLYMYYLSSTWRKKIKSITESKLWISYSGFKIPSSSHPPPIDGPHCHTGPIGGSVSHSWLDPCNPCPRFPHPSTHTNTHLPTLPLPAPILLPRTQWAGAVASADSVGTSCKQGATGHPGQEVVNGHLGSKVGCGMQPGSAASRTQVAGARGKSNRAPNHQG